VTKGFPAGIVVAEDHVVVAGRRYPFVLRRSARARRLTLRVMPQDGAVVLVLPRSVSVAAGTRFVAEQAGWIVQRQAARPRIAQWADGVSVPFRGELHRVRHCPDQRGRGAVWREAGEICVSGRAEYLPRRLRDWMKKQAQAEFTPVVAHMAQSCGVAVQRVTLRDTRSRWGSCSSSGALSFSWRLIMAPPPVLRYLVAHEVAHLRHMDHGPRFWKLVAELLQGEGDMRAARSWLRQHGAGLHLQGGAAEETN